MIRTSPRNRQPAALPDRQPGLLPRRWRRAGLLAGGLTAVVIGFATLMPVSGALPMGGGLDKLFHVLGFAALVFPLILTDSRRWPWAVPLAIAFGGAIELIQPSVGRTAEWLDFGADVTGVLIGAALGEVLHDRLRARRRRRAATAAARRAESAPPPEARQADLLDEMRVALREELTSLHPTPPAGADRDQSGGRENSASGPSQT